MYEFLDWPDGMRTANGTALCQWVQLYHYFVGQSNEFCHHNALCCFSTSVCVYFVIDSVRKLLDTPSYIRSYLPYSVGRSSVHHLGTSHAFCDRNLVQQSPCEISLIN